MKALILTFNSFSNKDKTKSYITMELYDLETKSIYSIFSESQYIRLPDGLIPSDAEIKKDFPRLADVDFKFSSYSKDGKVFYRPDVKSINSWKKAEIK